MKVPFFEPLYVILVYIHPYNSRTLNKQKIWLALGCPCSHLTINPRAHRPQCSAAISYDTKYESS